MEDKRSESGMSQIKLPAEGGINEALQFRKKQNSAYFPSLQYSAYGQRARMEPELGSSKLPLDRQQSAAFKIRTQTFARTSELQQDIELTKQRLNSIEFKNRSMATKLMNNQTLLKKLSSIQKKMELYLKADEKVKRKMLKVG